MYLRFLDSEEVYTLNNEVTKIGFNKVCLHESDIPEKTVGFEIVNDDDSIDIYHDYTIVYAVSKREHEDDEVEEYIIFSSDTRIHNVYYTYDENSFVTGFISTVNEPQGLNVILVRSGLGRYYENILLDEIYDENNNPKYKVVNGKLVETTVEDIGLFNSIKLKKAKDNKILYLTSVCAEKIKEGIEYNGEIFSYELTDQNNLYNSVQLAISTGLDTPYHANGKDCRLFTKDELIGIYILEQSNLTHNTTYNNQLKQYIESLENVEDVEKVYYGQELIGTYLETYNMIMSQAQSIVNAFIGA